MIRLGLCCKFLREPIKFRVTTARYVSRLTAKKRAEFLSQIVLSNAQALSAALAYCHKTGIGSFRINSQILPLKTHPQFGYNVASLPDDDDIVQSFTECRRYARKNNVRLSFHPDQFVLLSSPEENVTRRSIEELEYQAEVSEWVGADVLNIHGGGGYGDKTSALKRLEKNLKKLSRRVLKRLTLENDDRVYTPRDLLPFCTKNKIPFVYDVHHHRCFPDKLDIQEATQRALKTWNREPLFHLSSPREGWQSKTPQYHHDYIDLKDFPDCWRALDITVEVEAKAKEAAVRKLLKQLKR
jgi:UV DNA damage endonuclease